VTDPLYRMEIVAVFYAIFLLLDIAAMARTVQIDH
jgi:hypothetical protein